MAKKDAVVYLMVPRRLIIVWIISLVSMVGLICGATIWSNQQWCGIIDVFETTYKETPPTTPTGRTLQQEFNQLNNRFLCR